MPPTRYLAPATLFFCCLAGACTTPDVDPSAHAPSPQPAPVPTTKPDPSPTTNTWVPRENPELAPSGGPYVWKNVVIMGGGFVPGVEFGPGGTPYARTDVGGAYRWDDGPNGTTDGRWVPLLDWVGRADSNLMGVESIAPDPTDPNTVYAAVGEYMTSGNGQILSSNDRGSTWARHAIGVPMGGNANGRSMGERLAVDPNLPTTLCFGSRSLGLWRSTDSAATWQRLTNFPVTGNANIGLSWVQFDPRSAAPGMASSTIYVGVASTTGPSLYRSQDAGSTWNPVPGQPPGLMPHHGALAADGVLYLSYANMPGPGTMTDGAIWKVDTANDQWTNVTPLAPAPLASMNPVTFGYAGLALDAQHPGTLLVATFDYWRPDEIFRSVDGGAHWRQVGAGVRDVAGAQYLYWHNSSLINGGTQWAGGVAIDPTNSSRVTYGTGQGLWWSDDVDAGDAQPSNPTHWTFRDVGLEETVPLAFISPPSGAPLLSGLGDIAGFRHDDLDAPSPTGMFDNPVFGNTSSLDFAESNPALVARVGTASATDGRGALSTDGGATWSRFASEPTGSTGQGTIAMAADGSALVWVLPRPNGAAGTSLLTFNYSTDQGATWHPSAGIAAGARGSAIADRLDPQVFYALVGTTPYASADGGKSFSAVSAAIPGATSLRCPFGQAGDVWLVAAGGLYRSLDSAHTFTNVSATSAAIDLGFGKAQNPGDYPALYLAGTAAGQSGILRSDDAGVTWTRIDDDAHQFGYISHVSGDPRVAGRVYLGTGGRGIIYGDLRNP
jgi:hypothetical protein